MKPETHAQLALRVLRNFIEAQCREIPGARSRHACRERLRQLHGWKEKTKAAQNNT